MTPKVSLLYVTTKDREQALQIARTLLERRLIACANLLPGMESVYRWQGLVQTEVECVLVLKTRQTLVEVVTKAVEELHTYETPCVLELEVASGATKYLNWLIAETAPEPNG